LDQWGAIDFFDPEVDLEALPLKPLETDEEDAKRVDLTTLENDSRIALL
jgi:hypothetical protein